MRVAALTMVYDEAEYLPVWLRHHAAQLGIGACHVIDHGSGDGSVAAALAEFPGMGVIRLPRTPHDDAKRAELVADVTAGLLRYYDAVIYADVDELVVPARAHTLSALESGDLPEIGYAVGLNLLQMPEERALDMRRAVGGQRRFAWFASALCKPVLARRRPVWAPGFHSADAAPEFGALYLVHLRYADREIACRRLARTRGMAWARQEGGAHQRMAEANFLEMFARLQAMDRDVPAVLAPDLPPLMAWLERVTAASIGREAERYRFPLDIENYRLWALPEWLRAGLG